MALLQRWRSIGPRPCPSAGCRDGVQPLFSIGDRGRRGVMAEQRHDARHSATFRVRPANGDRQRCQRGCAAHVGGHRGLTRPPLRAARVGGVGHWLAVRPHGPPDERQSTIASEPLCSTASADQKAKGAWKDPATWGWSPRPEQVTVRLEEQPRYRHFAPWSPSPPSSPSCPPPPPCRLTYVSPSHPITPARRPSPPQGPEHRSRPRTPAALRPPPLLGPPPPLLLVVLRRHRSPLPAGQGGATARPRTRACCALRGPAHGSTPSREPRSPRAIVRLEVADGNVYGAPVQLWEWCGEQNPAVVHVSGGGRAL
jgi:hypothetical protein